MSYTPTNWSTGDTITASAMNKIENGIANAGNVMIIEDNGTQLDKTFAEIYELVHSGIPCYIRYATPSSTISGLDTEFEYNVVLMPVLVIKKYADMYRVYAGASRSEYISNILIGVPAIWTYQANISSDYPTFLRVTFADNTSQVAENARYI